MAEKTGQLNYHTVAYSTARRQKAQGRRDRRGRDVVLEGLVGDEKSRKKNIVTVHGLPGTKIECLPDAQAYENLFRMGRVPGNHISLSSYIEEVMRSFEDMRTYTGYLGAKRRDGGIFRKTLDHHLTVIREPGKGVWTREFDESQLMADSGRDLLPVYQFSKPTVVDFRAGLELQFTNMDHESNRCHLYERKKEDGLMKAYVPLPYGGEGSPPIGLAVMEGDLTPKGSKVEGFARLLFAAKAAVFAGAQIANQIMNKFDSTTNLLRKKDFHLQLERRVKALKKGKGGNCYLLLIDLDNFKRVNETYGYLAGDGILRLAGEAISSSVRGSDKCVCESRIDLVSRWAGDEFVVLLSGSVTAGDAFGIAKRIIEKMAAIELRVPGSKDPATITCSIGVVNVASLVKKTNGMDVDMSCEAIFETCEGLLKKSKRSGKNRIYFSDGVKEMEFSNGF